MRVPGILLIFLLNCKPINSFRTNLAQILSIFAVISCILRLITIIAVRAKFPAV